MYGLRHSFFEHRRFRDEQCRGFALRLRGSARGSIRRGYYLGVGLCCAAVLALIGPSSALAYFDRDPSNGDTFVRVVPVGAPDPVKGFSSLDTVFEDGSWGRVVEANSLWNKSDLIESGLIAAPSSVNWTDAAHPVTTLTNFGESLLSTAVPSTTKVGYVFAWRVYSGVTGRAPVAGTYTVRPACSVSGDAISQSAGGYTFPSSTANVPSVVGEKTVAKTFLWNPTVRGAVRGAQMVTMYGVLVPTANNAKWEVTRVIQLEQNDGHSRQVAKTTSRWTTADLNLSGVSGGDLTFNNAMQVGASSPRQEGSYVVDYKTLAGVSVVSSATAVWLADAWYGPAADVADSVIENSRYVPPASSTDGGGGTTPPAGGIGSPPPSMDTSLPSSWNSATGWTWLQAQLNSLKSTLSGPLKNALFPLTMIGAWND